MFRVTAVVEHFLDNGIEGVCAVIVRHFAGLPVERVAAGAIFAAAIAAFGGHVISLSKKDEQRRSNHDSSDYVASLLFEMWICKTVAPKNARFHRCANSLKRRHLFWCIPRCAFSFPFGWSVVKITQTLARLSCNIFVRRCGLRNRQGNVRR
jgi:hypothetical protein